MESGYVVGLRGKQLGGLQALSALSGPHVDGILGMCWGLCSGVKGRLLEAFRPSDQALSGRQQDILKPAGVRGQMPCAASRKVLHNRGLLDITLQHKRFP